MKTMMCLLIAAWAFPAAVPAYEKMMKDTPPGKIEVKTLPARTVIMTEAGGSYFDANNNLFGRLFRYIQMNDVAMTVPVKADIEPGRMYFYLGTEEVGKELRPLEGVVVATEPELAVMSIGVRGSYSQKNFLKAREQLLQELERNEELVGAGEPYAVFWNGPYVPGFMKRFEVHVPVETAGRTDGLRESS